MSRNVRMKVAYDGAKFFGWQRQDGFESVQGALEQALLDVTGQELTVRGSGRTDTGVHALAQVAHVHLDTDLADNRLWHAINANLPQGVIVRALQTAAPDFHAQRSAIGKRYGYLIETTRFPSPFWRERACFVRGSLDLERMRAAARHFVGEHDFTSMASTGSERKSNVRRVFGVHLRARKTGLAIVVGGSGFLYNMVRTMAGTLIQVGRGRIEPDRVAAILAAKNRQLAGPTAPAGGLYLLSVRYPEPLDWPAESP
jgi:tRNA pseudouridine38-40 synthase